MPDELGRKYIQRRADRWRIAWSEGMFATRYGGTFDSEDEARAARDAALEAKEPQLLIEGLGADDDLYTPEQLWSAALAAQLTVEKREAKRAVQRVVVPEPGRPFAVAFLADFHIGSAGVDYRSLKADVETIQRTPRLYAAFHGDGTDNWIKDKLARLERGQALEFDAEMQLFAVVLEALKGKLLWVVSGNHDNWTRQLAGVDRIREALRGAMCLYDRHEIVLVLECGKRRWIIKARHRWRWSSIYNPTHGIEVGWERGGVDFDIGIGGHTHTATLCRSFIRHGRERYAVRVGTYKISDEYPRELGLAPGCGRGCGALVFPPDDKPLFCESLTLAAEMLGHFDK